MSAMETASVASDTAISDDNNLRRISNIFLRHGLNPQSVPQYTAWLAASSEISKSTSKDEPSRFVRRAKRAAQRPQCTHVIVIRVHGGSRCHICDRVPSNGWLYVCQQDYQLGSSKSSIDTDIMPDVPSISDYFEAQAQVAEQLEMSASVIQGIRNHDYNVNAVERLLNQRRAVILSVKNADKTHSDGQPSSNSGVIPNVNDDVVTSVGVGTNNNFGVVNDNVLTTCLDHDSDTPSPASNQPTEYSSQARKKPRSACDFQVCHNCRPMFADRLYTSFEPILNGEVPYLTAEEIERLPLMNNDILSTVGMRKPVRRQQVQQSEESLGAVDHVIPDIEEEISIDWTPTSSSEGEETNGQADGHDVHPDTRNDYHQILERVPEPTRIGDPQSRSSTPIYTQEQLFSWPKSATSENNEDLPSSAEVHLFNTPGGASTASSISLPTPTTAPMAPLFPTDDPFEIALKKRAGRYKKASSTCCGFETHRLRRQRSFCRQDSSSSLGSEMEVEGGVALTEEAVGMGIPDILTKDVLIMREMRSN